MVTTNKVLEIITEFSKRFNTEVELKRKMTITSLSDIFLHNNIAPDEVAMSVFLLSDEGKLINNIDDCESLFDAFVIPASHNALQNQSIK